MFVLNGKDIYEFPVPGRVPMGVQRTQFNQAIANMKSKKKAQDKVSPPRLTESTNDYPRPPISSAKENRPPSAFLTPEKTSKRRERYNKALREELKPHQRRQAAPHFSPPNANKLVVGKTCLLP